MMTLTAVVILMFGDRDHCLDPPQGFHGFVV